MCTCTLYTCMYTCMYAFYNAPSVGGAWKARKKLFRSLTALVYAEALLCLLALFIFSLASGRFFLGALVPLPASEWRRVAGDTARLSYPCWPIWCPLLRPLIPLVYTRPNGELFGGRNTAEFAFSSTCRTEAKRRSAIRRQSKHQRK